MALQVGLILSFGFILVVAAAVAVYTNSHATTPMVNNRSTLSSSRQKKKQEKERLNIQMKEETLTGVAVQNTGENRPRQRRGKCSQTTDDAQHGKVADGQNKSQGDSDLLFTGRNLQSRNNQHDDIVKIVNEMEATYGIKQIDFEDLVRHRHIGGGGFGQVFKGVWRDQCAGKEQPVAIKVPYDKPFKQKEMKDLLNECKIMYRCQHKNIVKCFGFSTQICEDSFQVFLVMELCEDSLRNYLRNKQNSLSTVQCLLIAAQVARGMVYLAERKIYHRDLRSDNVLVKQNGAEVEIKISDFGLTRRADPLNEVLPSYISSNVFTPCHPYWAAPEALARRIFSEKSDVWSFGVFMVELFTGGMQPSPSRSPDAVFLKDYGCYIRRFDRPTRCPMNVFALMEKCWTHNPFGRPAFHEIVEIIKKILSKY